MHACSPSSIAGTMILLTGSQLCTREILPEGSEFLDDKELDVLLSKYVFSIGCSDEDDSDETRRRSKNGEDERPIRRRRYEIEAVERGSSSSSSSSRRRRSLIEIRAASRRSAIVHRSIFFVLVTDQPDHCLMVQAPAMDLLQGSLRDFSK